MNRIMTKVLGKTAAARRATRRRPTTTEAAELPPSKNVLWSYAIQTGVPFVGFGIADNAIMILAGDQIDASFGVTLGLSTLAAAGFGNMVSDLAGVGLGGVIEQFAARLGLPEARMTNAQRAMWQVKWTNQLGMAVGLTIGCAIGKSPRRVHAAAVSPQPSPRPPHPHPHPPFQGWRRYFS